MASKWLSYGASENTFLKTMCSVQWHYSARESNGLYYCNDFQGNFLNKVFVGGASVPEFTGPRWKALETVPGYFQVFSNTGMLADSCFLFSDQQLQATLKYFYTHTRAVFPGLPPLVKAPKFPRSFLSSSQLALCNKEMAWRLTDLTLCFMFISHICLFSFFPWKTDCISEWFPRRPIVKNRNRPGGKTDFETSTRNA